MENCIVWLRALDTQKIGAEVFGEIVSVVLEKNVEDTLVREKKTNEEFLEDIGGKRVFLNNILRRKSN